MPQEAAQTSTVSLAADFHRVRSVSAERLMRRVGALKADEIVAGIVIAVEPEEDLLTRADDDRDS